MFFRTNEIELVERVRNRLAIERERGEDITIKDEFNLLRIIDRFNALLLKTNKIACDE